MWYGSLQYPPLRLCYRSESTVVYSIPLSADTTGRRAKPAEGLDQEAGPEDWRSAR